MEINISNRVLRVSKVYMEINIFNIVLRQCPRFTRKYNNIINI